MIHLLCNVDESWRGILSTASTSNQKLYRFLTDLCEGNIEENTFPRPREIFKNFEEIYPNYDVVLISSNPRDRNISFSQGKILHLYVHMTYGATTEENLRHRELWGKFLAFIVKYLHKFNPVYVVIGPEAMKPLHTLCSDKFFQERPGLTINLEEDIQYTPVVLHTTKITENTGVLVNQLLKHKKKPLLKF